MSGTDKIGVTLGDPSGIGPEIVAKAMADPGMDPGRLILFGNRDNFLHVAAKLPGSLDHAGDVEFVDIPGNNITAGKVSGVSGRIARQSIEKAVEYAGRGAISGICTAPVNKEALILGGSAYRDHTAMLSGLTNSKGIVTVFESGRMRIIFLSKHMSLRDACDYVRKENVLEYIGLAEISLFLLGVPGRRIAVAALNPHSGENGMFGREELDEIIPAIEEAKAKFNVSGPFPADSVFHQAAHGKYDIVLSMYHDQGHIAAKVHDFSGTVSLNLGLPFLRTSVDHGTAFDIAGKGIADHAGMVAAIRKCLDYSPGYMHRFMDRMEK